MFKNFPKLIQSFRGQPLVALGAGLVVSASWAGLTYVWQSYLLSRSDAVHNRWMLAFFLAMTTFSIILDILDWVVRCVLERRRLRTFARYCAEKARQCD
jgi:hypothetical protein